VKTLGLIGGVSWESAAVYYRLLNQMTRARLGGHHSAALILHSFDFAPGQGSGETPKA
jgi:aspartate racemase